MTVIGFADSLALAHSSVQEIVVAAGRKAGQKVERGYGTRRSPA